MSLACGYFVIIAIEMLAICLVNYGQGSAYSFVSWHWSPYLQVACYLCFQGWYFVPSYYTCYVYQCTRTWVFQNIQYVVVMVFQNIICSCYGQSYIIVQKSRKVHFMNKWQVLTQHKQIMVAGVVAVSL